MSANVEYIVQVPKKATATQRDAIYRIIMTYSFPMSTNPINKALVAQLSASEKDLLNSSEIAFLRQKTNEVIAGVTLRTIPKSSYQLYFIVHAYENSVELPPFDVTTGCYTDDKTMNELILSIIHDPNHQSAWWTVNALLLRDWPGGLLAIDHFIESNMQRISLVIKNNINSIPYSYLRGTGNGQHLASYSPKRSLGKAMEYLKSVAVEEYFEDTFYFLYSGVSTASASEVSSSHSWSFSDGVMAGFLQNLAGDCALHYLVNPWTSRVLKTFSVNKAEYQKGNSGVSNLFYIPPIPNMLRLLGSGEFHHGRTRVSSFHEECVSTGAPCAMSKRVRSKIGIEPVFFANALTPEAHVRELTSLCATNYFETPTLSSVESIVPFKSMIEQMMTVFVKLYPNATFNRPLSQHIAEYAVSDTRQQYKTMERPLRGLCFMYSAHSNEPIEGSGKKPKSRYETQCEVAECISAYAL